MEDKTLVKTAQIKHLILFLQKNSNYIVNLELNGEEDFYFIKVKNQNNDILLEKKIESFSKKAEALILNQLEKIADELLTLKNQLKWKVLN